MENCGLTSQIKRIMYLNLNIVGGISTYAKQGCRCQMVLAKSHGSRHLFQKLLPTTICLAAKISKPLAGKWKLFSVGQAVFALEGLIHDSDFTSGEMCCIGLWVLSRWWMWWARSLLTEHSNSADKQAIAILPGVSHARAGRNHKGCVSSGMTLNLKPQHAFPELAMVCRTLTFMLYLPVTET